jgi:hypothetical protein
MSIVTPASAGRTARDVVQAGAFVQACRKVGLKRLVLPSFDTT